MDAARKLPPEDQIQELQNTMNALNRSQAVIEFNLDGTIIFANDNFLKCMGYSLGEIQGKHHSIFCDPEYVGSLQYRHFWEKLSRGEVEAGEFKRLKKNGREAWLIATYNPIIGADGKVSKVMKFATDVTVSKEELLVRTEIMNMTSIVSEADLKGDILTINDKFIEVSKYSKEELIGHPHNTTRHPDMPKAVFKEMWATIGRGKPFRGIIKNRAKDGTPYYVDAVVAPILGDNGKPKKYLGVRYDITEAELERQNMRGIFSAIDSAYAYIEFDMTGNILSANKIFLDTMGYSVEDLKSKHHRIFCDQTTVNSPDYYRHWDELKAGKSQSGIFKRVSKAGKDLWLQAVYAPVKDETGRVVKVVKIASDVTEANLKNAEFAAKINAISKAQAVIDFGIDGVVQAANENFLKTFGYSLDEIKGKHHRMFCEPQYASSSSYQDFWLNLGRGEFDGGRYKRIAKGGKVVWIQATYNPILDLNGKVFKVTKFATDISIQVEIEEAVRKMADNFLKTSKEISDRSSGVAQGAQALGATTEEMNASVEELTASINSIAQNAKNTDALAKATHVDAEIGSKSITKSIEAMELISKSSEDIAEIVKVISEIASQTNLLAFNAAIEAARAGEHGLGFSVVADEVRKLAERSSQATKDISKLINESVKRVAQGSEVSKQARDAFDKIVAGVNKTTQSISEVTCAAEEQLVAAKEISSAVQHVAEETEKSASASDEIANATKGLMSGSHELTATIARFTN
jgi:methyl-accepting chemotaxis protein